MSKLSAEFFSWVHAAKFYVELHREAVHLMPKGADKLWVDMGCGPGVLTRLAAQHGYQAIGIDIDPEMIAKAQQARAASDQENCQFECADLSSLDSGNRAVDVVSASSLLAVMDNMESAMEKMLRALKPGGTLLIIETNSHMKFQTAFTAFKRRIMDISELGLIIWGLVRDGRSPAIEFLNQHHFNNCEVKRHLLLDGLVEAWVIRKHESL